MALNRVVGIVRAVLISWGSLLDLGGDMRPRRRRRSDADSLRGDYRAIMADYERIGSGKPRT